MQRKGRRRTRRVVGLAVFSMLAIVSALFARPRYFYASNSACGSGVQVSVVYTWKLIAGEWVPDRYTASCVILPPGF